MGTERSFRQTARQNDRWPNAARENMRPQRLVILAFYFGSAVLLVMGHSFDDLEMAPVSDVPTISAVDEDARVTVWTPPYRKLELQVLPPDHSRSSGSSEIDETYVRPAWGLFAATVGLFFYIWTNTEHGGVIVELMPSLL